MTESYYVYETKYKNPRTCRVCGKGIAEGYLDELESECFCSKECLHKIYKADAVEAFIEDGLVFWTEWYDEIEVAE